MSHRKRRGIYDWKCGKGGGPCRQPSSELGFNDRERGRRNTRGGEHWRRERSAQERREETTQEEESRGKQRKREKRETHQRKVATRAAQREDKAGGQRVG